MDLGWIVNPDHMSQAAVDDTLTLLESRRYSGVISPHGWMDPGNWPRLWKLGGMAFPGHSGTDNYVKEWQDYRPRETRFAFGWGYGADLGGLSHQPDKSKQGSISYPFKSYDGKVSFERQKTGERTFDLRRRASPTTASTPTGSRTCAGSAASRWPTTCGHGAEAYLRDVGARERHPPTGCFRRATR